MAPIWSALRWPIIVYCAAEVAADTLAIARPGWARINAVALVVRYLYGIGVFAVALRADHLLVVASPVLPAWGLAQAQANFDKGMQAGIAVVIAIMLGKAALELWRLGRGQRATR